MSTQDLRAELMELLTEVRSEGRGVYRSTLGEMLDRRLPALVSNADVYGAIEPSIDFRERLTSEVSAACAKVREGFSGNGHVAATDRVPVRKPIRWGWALAGAAAVIVLTLMLYRVFSPQERFAVPSPVPKSSPNQTPIVPKSAPRPEGPVVQQPPKTRIEVRPTPVPTPRQPRREPERERLAQRVEIGGFGWIQGEPKFFEPGDAKPRIAREKTAFAAGTRIETGDMDRAEIKLKDGSVLRLAFNTTLVHRGGRDVASARDFEMLSGSVYAVVASTADHERFTIETPVATARVLATEFILGLTTTRAKGSGNSKLSANLQVKTGRVQFYNEFGDVQAGALEESTAVAGFGPTTPTRIGKLKERLFTYDFGHTHLTEYTSRLTADEARNRLVTGESGSPGPRLPGLLSSRLEVATRPALVGEVDGAIASLRGLAVSAPHPAVLNNLGVAYEMRDDLPAAIRSYSAAIRLDRGQPLYRYNLGFALQRIGNLPRSAEEFEEAVRLAPDFEMAIQELAHDYSLLERFEEALAVVDAGLRRKPKSATLSMARGTVFLDGGRFAEAETAYKRTIELDPLHHYAWYQLGYALRFQGKGAESDRAFERSVEIAPRDVAGLTALAGIRHRQSRYKESEELFKRALEIDPDNAMAHAEVAWLYENIDRSDEAEVHYRKALELDPDSSVFHNNFALLLYHNFKGREREAETHFRKAIALDPSHPNQHRGLAELLASTGRKREAEAHYRRAVDLGPGDQLSYKYFADFYVQDGRPRKAAELYLEGVRANPKSANFLMWIGWHLIEIHLWEEAVEVHRKWLAAAAPGHDALHAKTYLAYALINTGRLMEAEELVDEMLREHPDDTENASHRATILALTGGDLDEALKWAKKGASEPEPYGIRWHALGLVHFKRGEFEPAIEALEKAVHSFGGLYLAADALVLLGQVYEAKKDVPKAIEAYRRAIEVEPGNKPAAEALKRLGG